jgi:hypothetical protein
LPKPTIDDKQDAAATGPAASVSVVFQVVECPSITLPESLNGRDTLVPILAANSRPIAQPAQQDFRHSASASKDYLLVSTQQTLESTAVTVEGRQRQRWKDLVASVESLCLRFDYAAMRAYIFRVCYDPGKDQYEAFDKLASQDLIEPDFRVNLMHRRNMATYPDVWSAYTVLYEGRLHGLHDESSSNDYNEYLATLLKQSLSTSVVVPDMTKEETSTTPSLGQIRASVQYLVWDDTTMALTIRLDRSWFGKNGLHYEVPATAYKLAHVLIGTVNGEYSNRLEIGEDMIKRWHAKDHSQGQIRAVKIGVGVAPNRSGGVRPILPPNRTSQIPHEHTAADELIVDILTSS